MNTIPQEHELKAVLVADAAGYTRLMSENEQEAHALTLRCFELFKGTISEHHGSLVKTTGDGVMVEFGSAISAVRYGIDVQKRLKELHADLPYERCPHFRIGVHLGEIMHEGGDIYGHSVNVAARLEQFADPDGICVSEVVYDLVRRSMPVGFECIGPHDLKNVESPVTVYKVRDDLRQSVAAPTIRKPAAALTLPDRPSIAVLPLTNLGSATEMEFFADGMTEDVTTALSKFEDLFVISHNTAFFYRDSKASSKEIAAELGVRYLLEGSVRTAGDRVRISVQLVDGMTGRHLWAERYDRRVEDIFEVQDDVAIATVTALVGRIKYAEFGWKNELATENMSAYTDLLHGRELLQKYTATDNARAKEAFLSALDHDANYAPACAAMARACNYDWQFAWSEEHESGLDQALDWARRAISIDRMSPRAHAELGFSLLFSKNLGEAIRELRTALELNPNDCDVMAELSDALTFNGEMDEAIEQIENAMRLNPYYPDTYLWYLADAYYSLGRHDDVVATLEKMTNPLVACRMLAASHAHLGHMEQAEECAKQVLMLQPDFSVNDWVSKQPDINPKITEHLAEGLLKAGLPA